MMTTKGDYCPVNLNQKYNKVLQVTVSFCREVAHEFILFKAKYNFSNCYPAVPLIVVPYI